MKINQHIVNGVQSNACHCMGPQNGQPLCPCRMRRVQVVDGRYIETIDHGPVRQSTTGSAEWQNLMPRSVSA